MKRTHWMFLALIVATVFALVGCNSLGGSSSSRGQSITGPDGTTNATVVSFVADPVTVKVGSSVTLRWDTLNAVSANISASVGPNLGSVPLTGSRLISTTVVGTVTYTLTITASDGRQVQGFASVVVTP